MPALAAGIHVFSLAEEWQEPAIEKLGPRLRGDERYLISAHLRESGNQDVDGRDEPGHDDEKMLA